jgi:CheY-like chemotaxis protein
LGIRFLIIDDHEAYREWLGHHLTAEWSDSTVVSHDPSGGDLLPPDTEAADFDLLFLDHRWESGSGIEALSQLKQRRDCPPVICLTPQGDHSVIGKALEAGADDVLPKGRLEHDRLATLVRGALSGGRGGISRSQSETPGSGEDVPAFALKGHRFVRRIAVGGVSSIYLMERERDGEQAVVKVLTEVPDVADGKRDFDRFLQEYELISAIRHPNVVRIYDLGIADDHAFIVMEYFRLGDLKTRISQGINVFQAAGLLFQMAGALDAIHRVGVLHRDLKPGNVMCRDDGTIALIDFGLAKRMRMSLELTRTGEIFGTPYYMSPEQGHGEPADARSDIYSLGVIFYEMLTRKKPFAAASPMGVIYKHMHANIPHLPVAARPWQDLFESMVAKDPADRPESATELMERLSEVKGRLG